MQSTTMKFPLTLTHIFERAERLFPGSEVVSRLPDKSLHRCTYADFCRRARLLGASLQRMGLKRGDRVATLMWNHYAHLETYFAVPCAGGVVHTLNLRLHPDEIAYIVRHGGDRFLIVDDVLLPLYEKFRGQVQLEKVIVVPLSGAAVAEEYDNYESLAGKGRMRAWRTPKEEAPAGMCYTSGTTGQPKGVVYSHRALVLHSLASALPDVMGVSNHDSVTPVVPMFHAN